MHDAGYRLPRILLPRTRVNKGKEQQRSGSRDLLHLDLGVSGCEGPHHLFPLDPHFTFRPGAPLGTTVRYAGWIP
jgi:hypothetical protein